MSRAAARGFGAPAAACAEKGLRKPLFFFALVGVFCPELGGVESLRRGSGLALRVAGWKVVSRTLTKLEGNLPTIRGSRFKRPVHQEPSPAFRHSI